MLYIFHCFNPRARRAARALQRSADAPLYKQLSFNIENMNMWDARRASLNCTSGFIFMSNACPGCRNCYITIICCGPQALSTPQMQREHTYCSKNKWNKFKCNCWLIGPLCCKRPVVVFEIVEHLLLDAARRAKSREPWHLHHSKEFVQGKSWTKRLYRGVCWLYTHTDVVKLESQLNAESVLKEISNTQLYTTMLSLWDLKKKTAYVLRRSNFALFVQSELKLLPLHTNITPNVYT